MANQKLFNNKTGKKTKDANAVNRAGGIAYEYDPKHPIDGRLRITLLNQFISEARIGAS